MSFDAAEGSGAQYQLGMVEWSASDVLRNGARVAGVAAAGLSFVFGAKDRLDKDAGLHLDPFTQGLRAFVQGAVPTVVGWGTGVVTFGVCEASSWGVATPLCIGFSAGAGATFAHDADNGTNAFFDWLDRGGFGK